MEQRIFWLKAFCFLLLVAALVAISLAPSQKPQVVVYLDKDAKQPAMLPIPEASHLHGERAALWWTVFCKSIDHGTQTAYASNRATEAVEAVYGKAK